MDEAAALRELAQKLRDQVKDLGLALVDAHARMEAARGCVKERQKAQQLKPDVAKELLALLG